MEKIFAVCGILGGLLCCIGDILFDYKRKDNKKLGKLGCIESSWESMAPWRFPASILAAMFAVPMIMLGEFAMAGQLAKANLTFGRVFFFISLFGLSGSFFIHTILCLCPVIFLQVKKTSGFEAAEAVLEKVSRAILVPFFAMYLAGTIVPAFMVMWALGTGMLGLSPWWILLMTPCLMAISHLLKAVCPALFRELPHIIAPSLGDAMIALMALLSLMA